MNGNPWPPAVWQAVSELAAADLAHYSGHVFDREAFLGTARARRADQHRAAIDNLLAATPDMSAADLLRVLNPAPKPVSGDEQARRRDYDWRPVDCGPCGNVGRIPTVDGGVERWKVCPTCAGRKVPT